MVDYYILAQMPVRCNRRKQYSHTHIESSVLSLLLFVIIIHVDHLPAYFIKYDQSQGSDLGHHNHHADFSSPYVHQLVIPCVLQLHIHVHVIQHQSCLNIPGDAFLY